MTSPTTTEWRKDGYLVSTNTSFVSVAAVSAAFAQDDMYWAQPLPEPAMQLMINSSLCFGLYKATPLKSTSARPEKTSPPGSPEKANLEQIGFARVITDYVTFVYLTDVYVLKPYQRKGLGTWMMGCVREVIESMEYLRRSILITSGGERYYERTLNMTRLGQRGKATVMDWKGPGSIF